MPLHTPSARNAALRRLSRANRLFIAGSVTLTVNNDVSTAGNAMLRWLGPHSQVASAVAMNTRPIVNST